MTMFKQAYTMYMHVYLPDFTKGRLVLLDRVHVYLLLECVVKIHFKCSHNNMAVLILSYPFPFDIRFTSNETSYL